MMRRRGSAFLASMAALGALAAVHACAPMKFDGRTLFAQLTYPGGESSAPTQYDLELFAALQLEAISTYRNPRAMAACLRKLDPDFIERTGERLAIAGNGWPHVARDIKLPSECAPADDEALVRYVIARITGAATAFAHKVTLSEAQRQALVYRRVPGVLAAIAGILDKTPPTSEATADAPALALSGGSANGAFTAGFLFELLSLRERALPADGDGGRYRFSSIVGTSVGSLIAQILDFYFVDAGAPITPAKRVALAECNAYWTDKPRPLCGGVDHKMADDATCFGGWPVETAGLDVNTRLSGLDKPTRDDLAQRVHARCARSPSSIVTSPTSTNRRSCASSRAR